MMKSVAIGLVVVESVVEKVTRRDERVVVMKSFAVGSEAVDTAYVTMFSSLDTKHQGIEWLYRSSRVCFTYVAQHSAS